jgi:hypothetical protein
MATIPPLVGAEGLAAGTPPTQLLDLIFPGFSGMSDRDYFYARHRCQIIHE